MIGLRRVALLSSILPMADHPDSKLIGQITATLNGCAPLKLPGNAPRRQAGIWNCATAADLESRSRNCPKPAMSQRAARTARTSDCFIQKAAE